MEDGVYNVETKMSFEKWQKKKIVLYAFEEVV
jgi:hypothetical protein